MRRLALAAVMAVLFTAPAIAQIELKIMAPAAPGGGWDQTARAMQQALTAEKIARSVQVVNVPGAGGSVGLAQFVNGAKGDGNQLMVNGFVMVGSLLMNKSPVSLDQVTPIARLTEETQVIVVPANSPIKTAKDLAEAVKKDVAKITFAGGSAGGVDHIMAAMFAGAVGADASKVNYVPFSGGGESLAAILGGKVTAGISGYGEYEGPDQVGQAARDRRLVAAAPARRRRADLQGAGHRSRHHQLALGRGGARHQRRAEEGARRDRRQDGEVGGLEGHPEAEGLGRRLSFGRRLRQIPQGRAGAGERRAALRRPGEVVTRAPSGDDE